MTQLSVARQLKLVQTLLFATFATALIVAGTTSTAGPCPHTTVMDDFCPGAYEWEPCSSFSAAGDGHECTDQVYRRIETGAFTAVVTPGSNTMHLVKKTSTGPSKARCTTDYECVVEISGELRRCKTGPEIKARNSSKGIYITVPCPDVGNPN